MVDVRRPGGSMTPSDIVRKGTSVFVDWLDGLPKDKVDTEGAEAVGLALAMLSDALGRMPVSAMAVALSSLERRTRELRDIDAAIDSFESKKESGELN